MPKLIEKDKAAPGQVRFSLLSLPLRGPLIWIKGTRYEQTKAPQALVAERLITLPPAHAKGSRSLFDTDRAIQRLEKRIAEQIELVAQLICENKSAVQSVLELHSLERQLAGLRALRQ